MNLGCVLINLNGWLSLFYTLISIMKVVHYVPSALVKNRAYELRLSLPLRQTVAQVDGPSKSKIKKEIKVTSACLDVLKLN